MRETRTSGSTRGEAIVPRHRYLSYSTATRGWFWLRERTQPLGTKPDVSWNQSFHKVPAGRLRGRNVHADHVFGWLILLRVVTSGFLFRN